MSTTKQMSLMEMINRLSAGIEDDELFCQEEFEMVRNYCEQKSFMMSAADLSTIRRIGLMDRFESWKEEHRLYGLTFDQARKRKDYSFTLNELPSLIDDLQKDYMSATCENGDPYRGVAVLEVGYVDVELNITTYEQCGRSVTENDKRPILGYFVCIKQGEQEDDWVSDDYIDYEIQINWHDSNWQKNLERDMFFALNDYVVNHHLSYDEPNMCSHFQSKRTIHKTDTYEGMVLDYLELFDNDDHIVNRDGNNFLIANYRTFTSYKLEVIDGRLKVLQEAKVLQDCIENAKSAYDVDPEFLGKIQEFEKKWYNMTEESVHSDTKEFYISFCNRNAKNVYGIDDYRILKLTGPELTDVTIEKIEESICDYQFRACDWNADILAEVVMEQLKNEGYQVSAVIPEKIIFI